MPLPTIRPSCGRVVAPVPPLDTASVPEILESVLVACQLGTPLTRARTCPSVPAEVVASEPEPLPRRRVLAVMLAQPVPPLATLRMPVMSEARLMRELATEPEVALRKPETAARVKLEVKRLVEEAVVEKREVVVAAVMVALVAVKFCSVVEPWMRTLPAKLEVPVVEVAVRAANVGVPVAVREPEPSQAASIPAVPDPLTPDPLEIHTPLTA